MPLWRHQIDTGLSTEANYGRFYPGYCRPTNRSTFHRGCLEVRTPGRRTAALTEVATRTDFSLAYSALRGHAGLLQSTRWRGVPLAEETSLPGTRSVYCIHNRVVEEPVYIGETSALQARVATYAASRWPVQEPWLAYVPLQEGTPKHVLRELESDFLGWCFWQFGGAHSAQ